MADETLDEQELRQQLCNTSYQLWVRGILCGDSGLVSVKVNRRRYLVTPPGRRRGSMLPPDALAVDMGGVALTSDRGLDETTWSPHRLAYQADRSGMTVGYSDKHEVKATVLASPPYVMALMRLRPDDETLPLSDPSPVPIIDATNESAVRQAFEKLPAAVLSRRCVLCAGNSLDDVANTLERIEHAAMIEVLCLLGH
jgi:ribulose-5-phosphate 4-epimerase/fuculose-1-phosphate aldolase